MREWALLSWFEMAGFAAIRTDCCPNPAPLKLPPVGQCEPLDQKIQGVATAATSGGDVDAAIAEMQKAMRCMMAAGAGSNYPYPLLQGGEATALKKTLVRIQGAHAK